MSICASFPRQTISYRGRRARPCDGVAPDQRRAMFGVDRSVDQKSAAGAVGSATAVRACEEQSPAWPVTPIAVAPGPTAASWISSRQPDPARMAALKVDRSRDQKTVEGSNGSTACAPGPNQPAMYRTWTSVMVSPRDR